MAVPRKPEIAVIGGGITGLASAWELAENDDVSVTLLEASQQVGGKLRISPVAGVNVDEGAESMLAIRPEALRLASAAGLRPSIVHPATRGAQLLSRGALRALPPGLVSGVPTDLRALAASRVLSLPGLLRIPLDQVMGRTYVGEDVSVGAFLGERLGREVVDRIAEPLLAGVYAGNADELSLRMANPYLFRLMTRESSLLNAAKETRTGSAAIAGARQGPVFAGLSGGLGRLPEKLATALPGRGVRLRTGAEVTRMRRIRDGWEVFLGEERLAFDGVVLAAPAPASAGLLRTSAPFAAVQLQSVDYASVAIVTLAYRSAALPPLTTSGFLVPPIEGHLIKGVTYSTTKWDWLARAAKTSTRNGLTIIRVSMGRYGDADVLERDDADLAELARIELTALGGLPLDTVAKRVTRWDRALPQYRVGHVDLVSRAREALQDMPTLALAGAAFDGVGIPSCIASGISAARQVSRAVHDQAERRRNAHV